MVGKMALIFIKLSQIVRDIIARDMIMELNEEFKNDPEKFIGRKND